LTDGGRSVLEYVELRNGTPADLRAACIAYQCMGQDCACCDRDHVGAAFSHHNERRKMENPWMGTAKMFRNGSNPNT
jgi:hypothetical protein